MNGQGLTYVMLLVFSSSITMLPQASTMAAAGVVSQQLAAVFAVPGTATIFHVLSRKASSWQNFWKSVSVDEGRRQERRKVRIRLKLEAEEKAIKHQQEVWHLRNGCPNMQLVICAMTVASFVMQHVEKKSTELACVNFAPLKWLCDKSGHCVRFYLPLNHTKLGTAAQCLSNRYINLSILSIYLSISLSLTHTHAHARNPCWGFDIQV